MAKFIDKCRFLNYFNTFKHTKSKHYHYYPIMYICMNVRRGRPDYRRFYIILDSGCSYTTVNRIMTQKLEYKPAVSTEWITQEGNFITKSIIKVEFILPEFSTTKIVT